MNPAKISRSSEWWGYKVPTVLLVAYAMTLFTGQSFYQLIPAYIFIIISLSVMGVYASIINDFTDMEIDQACGKSNYMIGLSSRVRTLLLLAPLLIIGICSYLLYPHILSLLFYLLTGISISLYSFPPFRLKNHGFWGILSCAMAEQLFPSLFCAFIIWETGHQPVPITLIACITCFSLLYGIRCILWHQFLDRENDLQASISTFATRISPSSFRVTERYIFIVETTALLAFLLLLAEPLPFVFIPLYLLLVYFRLRKYHIQVVITVSPDKNFHQVIGSDYYQFFLPVSLLLSRAFTQTDSWIVLAVHILLFHRQAKSIAHEYYLLLQALAIKLLKNNTGPVN